MATESTVSAVADELKKTNVPGPNSFAASQSISIVVGPDRARYTAHKEILVNKCPFFANCLGAGMKEENDNEVAFPDDTCLAFDLFFLWIYSHEVAQVDSHDKVLTAMDAWVLADKFCMPDWQNTLIDGIMSFWKTHPMAPKHLTWLHENAGQSSLLFMLGAKLLVWELAGDTRPYENEWLADLNELLEMGTSSPGKLLCSIVSEAKSRTGAPAQRGCRYHVHLDGKAC